MATDFDPKRKSEQSDSLPESGRLPLAPPLDDGRRECRYCSPSRVMPNSRVAWYDFESKMQSTDTLRQTEIRPRAWRIMSKVFVNIGLSLDGYMAPEGMTMQNPGYKNWGAKWGAPHGTGRGYRRAGGQAGVARGQWLHAQGHHGAGHA